MTADDKPEFDPKNWRVEVIRHSDAAAMPDKLLKSNNYIQADSLGNSGRCKTHKFDFPCRILANNVFFFFKKEGGEKLQLGQLHIFA